MNFPSYNNYRKSGNKWLVEIPDTWDFKRIKFVSKLQGGYAFKSDLFTEEGTPIVRIGDIASKINWEGCKKYDNTYVLPKEFLIKKDDTLIALSGATTGKTCYILEEPPKAYLNQRVAKVSFSNKFIYYFLNSDLIQKLIRLTALGSAQENISNSDIENFIIPLPPVLEQLSIANFLEKETTRLDALIAKKQQLIETLKEKRIAVISHAVTKGLNPDVPMKDSGIEWIGKIPENWNASPIKFIVSTPITDGPHTTPDFIDEGIPFISAEAIEYGGINFNKKRGFISEEDHKLFSLKYKPKLNDIYVVKSGSTTGKIAFVDTEIEFNIWSPLAAVRVKKEFSPKFVFYALSADSFQKQISLFWSFGTQPNIGMGVLQNLKIAYPDLNTQLEIVSSIDRRIEKIDITVQKTEMFVSKLQEYKTALISAAVTGKIKVPEQA